MTLPMTKEEKEESIEQILKETFMIFQRCQLIKYCLQIFSPGQFESDEFIFAKNKILEISEISSNIDHRLHEIIDAPLLEKNEGA